MQATICPPVRSCAQLEFGCGIGWSAYLANAADAGSLSRARAGTCFLTPPISFKAFRLEADGVVIEMGCRVVET